MYLGGLEKSMMSRLGGQAALAILGVHPWGRADQLDQAPWEEGPGAREHPQHPARGGKWSSWERNSQVLFASQTWKVPTPCLTWDFSAWASGSDAPRLGHTPNPPHPHPSPRIDSLPHRPQQSTPPPPSFSHICRVFLTTRKMTLLYFLTSTNASSPCVQ